MPIELAREEARLILYSAGNFGKNLVWTAAEVTLLFVLTNLLRVPSSAAGWIVLLALLADAALGLLVGAMLARSLRPGLAVRFALVSAPLCGVAFAVLYAAPAVAAPALAIAGVIVFRAAYAFLDVPHNMMMTRVTDDSRARSRVAGYRFLFGTLGVLAVAGMLLPALAGNPDPAGALRRILWFGIGGGLAIALTIAGAVAAIGERVGRGQAPVSLAEGLIPPMARPLPSLYAIALITGLALPMFARLLLFDTGHLRTFDAGPAEMLAAITVGQFGGVAVWTWLAARHDKIVALGSSHATVVVVCAIFAGVALSGGRLTALPTVALCGVLGFGLAGVFSLPWAALCATIDLVEHVSGERSEPQAFAYFLAALKVGAALGTAGIAWSLASVGYAPGATQPDATRQVIMAGGMIVPMVGSILCLFLCRRLRLSHDDHARIMARLTARVSLV